MSGRAPISVAAALIAAAAAAAAQVPPPREPTQSTLPPTPAVAFPPAVSVMLGVSTYGARASQSDSLSYGLSGGPIVSARIQSPLTRRLGLHVAGAITNRSLRESVNGEPVQSFSDHVITLRAEGGLLFRFKPAAPIYFGGSVVYYRHGSPPVFGQTGGTVTELGGGFGIGGDFGRKPGSSMAGRVEYWSYFVSPKASGLPGGYAAESRARDWALSFGFTFYQRP